MANDTACVLCGESLGMFRTSSLYLAGTRQCCCKTCAKEAETLSQEELCRRVLQSGHAAQPERLQARLEQFEQAQQLRPKCSACGTPMKFSEVVQLDCTPMMDSILCSTFDLLPAHCPACCKIDFYSPQLLEKDEQLAALYKLDTNTCGI